MIIYTISLIILVLLFLMFSIMAIIGFLSKPQYPLAINLNPDDSSSQKPQCLQENIQCKIDQDCNICSENIEFKCVTLNRPSNIGTYGPVQSICKPAIPSETCNQEHGGIWVWTGYGETNTQDWSCVCAYPGYFGNLNDGCTSLNPGICQGGTFTYNAYEQNTPPNPDNCTCGDGYTKVIVNGIPICAPSNISNFY